MIRRLLAVLVASGALLLALAAPAGAHVTVNPNTAPKGGLTKLTFRVPSESDTASTVKLEVAFPDPNTEGFAFASVKPHAGWTYSVQKTHLAKPIKSDDGDVTDVVSTITWTATDPSAAIKPGEFDEFDVSVGPLPTNTDSLEFKAVQTYSDGSVVRWIESGESAEHPAPTLKLTSATATSSSDSSGDSKDNTARVLGGLGLFVGALGLLAALVATVRGRRG